MESENSRDSDNDDVESNLSSYSSDGVNHEYDATTAKQYTKTKVANNMSAKDTAVDVEFKLQIQSRTEPNRSWLQNSIEKLLRNYSIQSLSYFTVEEGMGEDYIYASYDQKQRSEWEKILQRSHACHVDLKKNGAKNECYRDFMKNVSHKERKAIFKTALCLSWNIKGAADIFQLFADKSWNDIAETFPAHLVKLVENKTDLWFDRYEAIAVRLTGTITLSGSSRKMNGVVDAFCSKDDLTYLISFHVTASETPSHRNLIDLCLADMLALQHRLVQKTELQNKNVENSNLGTRNRVKLCMLILHTRADKAILRLWEYTPSAKIQEAIQLYDLDRLIELAQVGNLPEFNKNLLTREQLIL